jgi:hypothetical protein
MTVMGKVLRHTTFVVRIKWVLNGVACKFAVNYVAEYVALILQRGIVSKSIPFLVS